MTTSKSLYLSRLSCDLSLFNRILVIGIPNEWRKYTGLFFANSWNSSHGFISFKVSLTTFCKSYSLLLSTYNHVGNLSVCVDALLLPTVIHMDHRINKKECGTFTVTTSNMTMETMAVKKKMDWLGTQNATHVCDLSLSMNMLQKATHSGSNLGKQCDVQLSFKGWLISVWKKIHFV